MNSELYDDMHLAPELEDLYMDDLEDEGMMGDEFAQDYLYDEENQFYEGLTSTWMGCIKPTLIDAYSNLLPLFLLCFLYRAAATLPKFPAPYHHIISCTIGLSALYTFFGLLSLHMILLYFAGFILFKTSNAAFGRNRGFMVAPVLLGYLTLSELFTVDRSVWERVRGPQMVAVMKIVSFTFDYDFGPYRHSGFIAYAGYMFCPGTTVFGPWVSFGEYMLSFENDKWDLRWIGIICLSLIKSAGFFIHSVCLIEWAIPSGSSSSWLMYRDALLFRVGHYFVSYVSTTSALLSGFSRVDVTHPLSIETPYSLVQVVVNWNLPIHRWLKAYVFRTLLPAGTFVAIMATYAVSSLLHGINARQSGVLLSLGIFTYVEHCLRSRLAALSDACIGPRPCPSSCSVHRNSSANNLIVHTTNILFSVLAIFHLAYLGCLMNTSGQIEQSEEPFARWSQYNFVSHYIVLGTYGLYLILKLKK